MTSASSQHPYRLYAGIVGVTAIGLWLILAFGATLRAPVDLAGKWELYDGDSRLAHDLEITQSGRYVRVSLPGRPAMNMRITSEKVEDAGFVQRMDVQLRGGGGGARSRVEVSGIVDDDRVRVVVRDGPVSQTYLARRPEGEARPTDRPRGDASASASAVSRRAARLVSTSAELDARGR